MRSFGALPKKTPSDSWKFLLGCGGIIALVCLGCGGCLSLRSVEYSDGHRDGHLQKFASKGLFWKTPEGELALPGWKSTGGDKPTTSNTWEFSVLDQALVAQLEAIPPGAFIRVYYRQRLCHAPWTSDTSYYVYKVEVIKE